MTYFTADQHFGHFNIIRLNHRPGTAHSNRQAMFCAKA